MTTESLDALFEAAVEQESDRPDAVADAADAVRRALTAVLRTRRDLPGLAKIAERVHALADDLEPRATPGRDRVEAMWSGESGGARHSPVSGARNAAALPVIWDRREDGAVEGHANFTVAYQGPAGFVHGGISALILDVALAVANRNAGSAGMTAGLTIRYLRPTPLYQDLTIRAWHESREGRKIRSRGEIRVDGKVCVTAEGVFVAARTGASNGDD
ncbi:PaaI family thioesterase [Rhodococcus opacus]|uniref:PaaI family thioesterase n=1 Tax=Rhodococcus opacus TaxID=37919 RepID=UPI001C45481C|nr:PaaI family thioesterase [Rhodococcus opacus]MBV6756232.1 PaaI family thioesterase [Rhodococcus opacus]